MPSRGPARVLGRQDDRVDLLAENDVPLRRVVEDVDVSSPGAAVLRGRADVRNARARREPRPAIVVGDVAVVAAKLTKLARAVERLRGIAALGHIQWADRAGARAFPEPATGGETSG